MALPKKIGPYRILAELGRGGMGVVYRAEHEHLHHTVALKILLATATDATARTRFLTETRAMDRLQHPHMVRVLDAGEWSGNLYLASELVEGGTLTESVKQHGALSPDLAVSHTIALAGALEALHQAGILHRDLKPDNVLLDVGGSPKLADFGLALLAQQDERLTRTGEVMGTPGYMAPEQAAGEKDLHGPPSDVYGLGATLYFLLTGRAPFSGSSAVNVLRAVLMDPPAPPSRHCAGLDPALEAIVLRCLAKEPDQRYPSATALGEALEGWQASRLEAAHRPAKRPAWWIPAAVILVGAGLAAGLLASRGSPPPSALPTQTPAPTPISEPRIAPVRLDRAVLAAPVPGLEALEAWTPLGILPDGDAIRVLANGLTRPELCLPLDSPSGDFSLEAELSLRTLERSNRVFVGLQLDERRVGVEWVCQGSRSLEEPATTRTVRLLGCDRSAELGWEPDLHVSLSRLGGRWACQVDQGGRALLHGEWTGDSTAERWSLRVGANLEETRRRTARQADGDPTRVVDVTLSLDLDGLAAAVASEGQPLGLAGLSWIRGELRAEDVPKAGDPFEADYLRLLASRPQKRTAQVRALWEDPRFDRRWRAEVFLMHDALRDPLATVFREALAEQVAPVEVGDGWLGRYGRQRIWGNKGRGPNGLKAPAGIENEFGAEDDWLAGDWQAAHDDMTSALLAFHALGGRGVNPRGAAMVALYTGQVEKAYQAFQRVAAAERLDAFMTGQHGFAAYRTGRLVEALEAWEPWEDKIRQRGGRPGGSYWLRHLGLREIVADRLAERAR